MPAMGLAPWLPPGTATSAPRYRGREYEESVLTPASHYPRKSSPVPSAGKAQLSIRPGRSARLAQAPAPGVSAHRQAPPQGQPAISRTCRSRRRSYECSSCPPLRRGRPPPPPRHRAAGEPRRTQTESTRSRYPSRNTPSAFGGGVQDQPHRFPSEPSTAPHCARVSVQCKGLAWPGLAVAGPGRWLSKE